jgi:hypothetical protein
MTPLMKLRLETAFGTSSIALELALSVMAGNLLSRAADVTVLRNDMHGMPHLSSWITRNLDYKK